MRPIPCSRSALHHLVGFPLYACLLMVTFSAAGDARQMRSLTPGVYSAEQAARGQQLYAAQCANCHGKVMEGAAGPPIVGSAFLANYSARPLAALVDKIHKTMPFGQPGSLSRQQSIDLAAFILQAGKFPGGRADLTEGDLAQIAFPAARAAVAPRAAPTGSLPPPEGNLAELMRAIAFPNSNIIFNLQIKDPGKEPKRDVAAQAIDYVAWGSTVYPGWLAVDQAAVAITETAPLLLTPGRKCQNGRDVPIDRADWKQYVADLVAIGRVARQEAKARNFDAFVDISAKLSQACANCHMAYRDKGGNEGSAAQPCT
jgi:S-disulfanyl-L-cysteine oxidoreductase SoxD